MNLTASVLIVIVFLLAILSLTLQRNVSRTVVQGVKSVDVKSVAKRPRVHTFSRSDYGTKSSALSIETPLANFTNDEQPFVNRWQARFAESENRGKKGGYLFHKHIRKAGGTTLRAFFYHVLEYHDQSRSFDLSPVAQKEYLNGDFDGKRKQIFEKKQRKNNVLKKKGVLPPEYAVHYIEQEFDAMDWQCPTVDPRWDDSLRIISLRHPIERHFSEFFYSGPGRAFQVNKTNLFANEAYTNELAGFIKKYFPIWRKDNHAYQKAGREGIKAGRSSSKYFDRLFGRYYTDNFLVRALSGSSEEYDEISLFDRTASNPSHKAPNENCTMYFIFSPTPYDSCNKGEPMEECPAGCDGPCFYETMARGPLEQKHLDRAKHSLQQFDAVLLIDRFNEEEQSDFLSDLVGIPRDIRFALKNKADGKNFRVEKSDKREKTHFYRDLMTKLKLDRILTLLQEENALEIELFKYAKKLNEVMLDKWKKEASSLDTPHVKVIAKKKQLQVKPAPSEDSADDEEDKVIPKKPPRRSSKPIPDPNADRTEDAHEYAVAILMYHKTGYVLSRLLMKLTIGLEYEGRDRTTSEIKDSQSALGHSLHHYDEDTGETIAFSQMGNWNSNFVKARRHGRTNCPTAFELKKGTIHLQEAPDFFCSNDELTQRMLRLSQEKDGKAKVVHFIRNPFDMVLSNYFYHSQEPTPEPWVHVDDPCEQKYENGEPLADHVLPTLKEHTKISHKQLDAVVTMCKSLYRSKTSMKDASFYDHLRKFNHWDGLKLATAQMIIASSAANGHMAGGDILRMVNNVIKLDNVKQKHRENFHLLSLSMDEYIKDTEKTTLDYLNFVFGSDDVVSDELRMREAKAQEERGNKQKKGVTNNHVTQGKHDDKEELKQRLRDDDILGPILSEVEKLVNRALKQSEEEKLVDQALKLSKQV